MQKLKKGFRTIDHKDFIQHVINNNIPQAVANYISMVNYLGICGIKHIDTEEELNTIYEKRLVTFLHDIVHGEPMKDVKNMMEKWQKSELKCTHRLQPVLPEDIIKNYSVLIKTLLLFLREYNDDFIKEHEIVSYFEDLEMEIEHLIFSTFKEIQKKAYNHTMD